MLLYFYFLILSLFSFLWILRGLMCLRVCVCREIIKSKVQKRIFCKEIAEKKYFHRWKSSSRVMAVEWISCLHQHQYVDQMRSISATGFYCGDVCVLDYNFIQVDSLSPLYIFPSFDLSKDKSTCSFQEHIYFDRTKSIILILRF